MTKSAIHAAVIYTLLAHLLVVAAMAVSPELHERIHADADDQDHECVVTLFVNGACHTSFELPFVCGDVRFETTPVVFPATLEKVPSCYLRNRILEHAPPANS